MQWERLCRCRPLCAIETFDINRIKQQQAYISRIHSPHSYRWHSIVSYEIALCACILHTFSAINEWAKPKHTSEYFYVVDRYIYIHSSHTSHTRCKTNNSCRTTTAWQWMGKCLKRNRMKSERNENWRTSVINSHNENQLNLFKTKCQFVRSNARSLLFAIFMSNAWSNVQLQLCMHSIFYFPPQTHRIRVDSVPACIYLDISDRAGCGSSTSSTSGGSGGSKRIQIKLASI